jgi:hypothetical protein
MTSILTGSKRSTAILVAITLLVVGLYWQEYLVTLDTLNPPKEIASEISALPQPTATELVTSQSSNFGSVSRSCPLATRSYEPLGNFVFFGKPMNESSPCPTAGMNNQIVMLVAFLHCLRTRFGGKRPFLWKDISCSPTGGKEGMRQYRVGSTDYTYAWFRWSEIFLLPSNSGSEPNLPLLCLHDNYSWSENGPSISGCSTTLDRIYGSKDYWSIRSRLPLRPRFNELAQWLLAPALEGLEGRKFVSVHLRRGDYGNFCRQTKGSSGEKKFRIGPVRWLGANATGLSRSFLHSCAPNDAAVYANVRKVIETFDAAFVFLATNSQEFASNFARSNRSNGPNVPVWTLGTLLAAPRSEADLEVGQRLGVNSLSHTERVILDMNILSMGSAVILNKYSTFSQSVIDFRYLRDGSLAGMKVYWW